MKLRDLTLTAIFAALLCVASPWSIPIGPIPITLATFVIYLAGALLGWKRGTMAVAVYLLLGLAGLPVFTGFAGGAAKLVGPTGGYLVGYIPCALLTGILSERFRRTWADVTGMLLGTVVLYALGTVWFCIEAGSPLGHALTVCVLPFLPGDAGKIAAAAALAAVLRPALNRITQKSA